MPTKKIWKRLAWAILLLFILMNVLAGFHAYKFTHFTNTAAVRTDPKTLSVAGKIKTILFGVDNPRPVNRQLPVRAYETVYFEGNGRIEAWYLKKSGAKGTVALFHGYAGEKSAMLPRAYEVMNMGYNVLLVDFMGSGGSAGNYTTIGYKESKDVKAAYNYLAARGEKNIFLLGTSLGAAAVLKALHDDPLQPRAVIIECPFATLYDAACARFKAVGAPAFPMAGLVVFWGGIETGFRAFSHRPVSYAASVQVPVLYFYGEKDERVTRAETDAVYGALRCEKKLVTFPEAGHTNYLGKYRGEWCGAVDDFLNSHVR